MRKSIVCTMALTAAVALPATASAAEEPAGVPQAETPEDGVAGVEGQPAVFGLHVKDAAASADDAATTAAGTATASPTDAETTAATAGANAPADVASDESDAPESAAHTASPTDAAAGDKSDAAGGAATTDSAADVAATATTPAAATSASDAAATADATASAAAEPAAPQNAFASDGVYTLVSADDASKVVDIDSASTDEGGRAQVYDANSTPAQRFAIEASADGTYCTIRNVNSGLVLDVSNGYAVDGNPVWQYTPNGTAAQRWIAVANSDGSWTFYSALRTADGGLLVLGMDADTARTGATLVVSAPDGKATQRWFAQTTRTLEDGYYEMESGVSASSVLDIEAASRDNEANAQLYERNGTNAQRFAVAYDAQTGYYTIENVNSGMVLDVDSAAYWSEANVRQYTPNGTFAQAWSIEQVAGGWRVVAACSGLALDVCGASSDNGTNIWQYAPNGTDAQVWRFNRVAACKDGRYEIVAAGDDAFALDVESGSCDEYANVQLYERNGTNAQRFEVRLALDGSHYTIRSIKSGKYLTVAGEGAEANVMLASAATGLAGQLWTITPMTGAGYAIRTADGRALDVRWGDLSDGSNVWVYTDNGTAAQRFYLVATGEGASLGITDVSVRAPKQDTGAVATVHLRDYDDDTARSVLYLPAGFDARKVVLGFVGADGGDTAQISSSAHGGFTSIAAGQAIDISSFIGSDGTGALYVKDSATGAVERFSLVQSKNIPAMFITSADPVNEGRTYIESSWEHTLKAKGSLCMVGADGTVVYDGALSQIKGRGNTSWSLDKRPYQIKLDKKTSLIDGTKGNKAKTWVLLANAADDTMLRQYLASKLGLAVGLSNTPDCEFVDLYYDGAYRGTYLLSEKVEVNKGRVDIDEIENASTDGTDISEHDLARATNAYGYEFSYVTGVDAPADQDGGYLLEIDPSHYQDKGGERSWFQTNLGAIVLKSPEDASYGQVKYVSELVQRALDQADAGDLSAFDMDSLARTWLVEEFAKNPDYIRVSSTYLYKQAGDDALYSGPLWDFDSAFGIHEYEDDTDFSSPEGFETERYQQLIGNADFRSAVKEIWEEERATFASLLSGHSALSIDRLASLVASSQAMNDELWDGPYDNEFGFDDVRFSSPAEAVSYLKQWVSARISFIDGAVADW